MLVVNGALSCSQFISKLLIKQGCCLSFTVFRHEGACFRLLKCSIKRIQCIQERIFIRRALRVKHNHGELIVERSISISSRVVRQEDIIVSSMLAVHVIECMCSIYEGSHINGSMCMSGMRRRSGIWGPEEFSSM